MADAPLIRKKKQLEIFLESVPRFPKPDPTKEQYKTPSYIAADIVFSAFSMGDIENKTVIDLGCGTGIFSIAAKSMGAKSVIGIDMDENAVAEASEFAVSNDLEIKFEVMDIADCKYTGDTLIQNPPFGSQHKKADRIFLEKAISLARIIYSLHNTKSVEFIRHLVEKLGFSISFEKNYIFKLEHTFDFHNKEYSEYDVTLFRLEKV